MLAMVEPSARMMNLTGRVPAHVVISPVHVPTRLANRGTAAVPVVTGVPARDKRFASFAA